MKKFKSYLQPISFFIILLVFASCQKEPTEPIDAHDHTGVHSEKSRFFRSEISLNDFQNKFLNKYSNQVSNYFIPSENRGGDDYIVEVNTERIVEFSGDSVTTYTFNVETSDEDNESFTNLILFERNGQSGEVIFKYTPTTEWVNELANGNKTPFSGTLSLMSTEGEVIQADAIIDGEPQGKVAPCLFTAIPIWVDCYGAECPCPDGNGYLGGWDVSVSCLPGSGGGGEGGTGTGTGPGGGSGSPYGGGDLPTDPVEWALFMDFVSIRGENDSFIFNDPTINENNSADFENFEEFETFINSPISDIDSNIIPLQDGTFNSHIIISLGLFKYLDIFINQTLKTTNINYQIHSFNMSYSGNTIGTNWTLANFWTSYEGNNVIIDIFGEFDYNLYFMGLGTLWEEYVHYEIVLNMYTGEMVSFNRID